MVLRDAVPAAIVGRLATSFHTKAQDSPRRHKYRLTLMSDAYCNHESIDKDAVSEGSETFRTMPRHGWRRVRVAPVHDASSRCHGISSPGISSCKQERRSGLAHRFVSFKVYSTQVSYYSHQRFVPFSFRVLRCVLDRYCRSYTARPQRLLRIKEPSS